MHDRSDSGDRALAAVFACWGQGDQLADFGHHPAGGLASDLDEFVGAMKIENADSTDARVDDQIRWGRPQGEEREIRP